MTVKTQRKTKAGRGPSKTRTPRNGRSPARKTASKPDGKYPLAAYEHLHIGIVQAAPDGRYQDVNDEFCRILGYSRKELLQFSVKDCTHEEDYILDIKLYEQLVAGQIPFYGLEKRYIRKDGKIVWVELTRSLVRDEAGKPLCTLGVVIDISDRKHVERVLRESGESLRLATEAARMFKWQLDLQKQVYIFADNFSQVLGFSAGLLPQNGFETVRRLSPEEDVQAMSDAIAHAIATHGDLNSLPYRVIDPANGETVWLELSAKIAYDEAGNAQRLFGVAQNITESKKAQEQIRTISTMSAENPNPLMRLTADGRVLYANAPGQDLLAAWRQQTHQTIPDELQQSVSEVFHSGLKKQIEIEHEQKIFLCTLVPIREAGHVNFYGSDITERKLAENALRESEERFRAIVNQATAGIAESDRDTHLIFANPKLCEMLGYSESELIGKTISELTYSGDLDENPRGFEPILAEGESYQFEKRFIRKDGSLLWANVSMTKVRDRAGKPTGGVSVVVDINERKHAEQALAEFARQQEALYRLSDELHHISSLEDVYNAALDAILTGLQCDRASILLFDETGVMRFVAWRGLSEAYRSVTEGHSPWDADEQNPYPICISDIRTADLSDSLKAAVQAEGIGGLAFIPLLLNGKLIGKFMVYFNEPHDCHDVEIELGLMIARQLAFGIDQKRAEAQLRASEALYRTIARSIPGGGVYVVDKDFRYLIAEGAVTEAFGLTREMLEGRTVSEVFPDDRGTRMEERLRRVFAGETISFETKNNGRVFWTQLAPLLDSIGQVIILTLDITERKQAEEALRQSEERFVRFMQHLPGLAWIKDLQGRYVYANAAAEKAFGAAGEKLYHKTDWEIFPLHVAEEFTKNDEQALLSEKGMQTVETLRQEDEVLHYSLVTKFPIPGPDGQPALIGGTAFDITERLQADEALRKSEARYRTLFDMVPVAVYTCDAKGLIQEYNQRAVELWGREPKTNDPSEKYCGSYKLYYPDGTFMPPQESPMSRVLSSEVPEQTEVEVIVERPDGSRRTIIAHPLLLKNERGQITGAINCFYDITERKQAIQALYESEERFKAILRQATAGIVRKDAGGKFIFVNQAFCSMLGYTEADLLGKAFWQFVYEEDQEENKRLYDRLMLEGVPFKLEKRLIRRDGSMIWVDVSVSPVMDAEGKPQSAVAVEVDITARKQAEESLQQLNLQLESRVHRRTVTIQAMNQSLRDEIAERKRIEEALRASEAVARANEEKLRTLFDLLPVGISFLDPKGRILQMNSALANIVHLSKDQLLGRTYQSRKYIRADGTLMSPAEFASARALATGRTVYNVETGILLENGEVLWTSVSAAPVDVADVGVVIVTVDITDRKRAERELQESHGRLRILSQRLVEVQEEERRALARELHDRVGQTLAALNINLIIIDGQLTDEASQQIGARLNDSMKLVAETIALVRDVMTDLRPSVLDDYGLEAALESQLSKFISRYDIKAILEKPEQPLPRLGPSIEMTFLRIAQEALMNIARHAHAEHVSMTLRQAEKYICLTIQDDGIGIESWQEANRPGSHGLTIMRERADAFGGELQVSSAPGQGTIVEVSIPFQNGGREPSQKERRL